MTYAYNVDNICQNIFYIIIYLIVSVFFFFCRHSLTQMYGRVEDYLLEDLPDVVLEHKIDMCKLLLQVLDVIEPGYSRIRGKNL